MTTKSRLLGVAFAVLSANLFSSKVILVKLAYAEGATPMLVLGIRMVTALPFFLAMTLLLLTRGECRPGWRDYMGMTLVGLLGYYVSSVLDFYGIQHVSAGMERLLLYLYPGFLVGLKCVIEKTLPKPIEGMAVIVAYAGVALFYGDENKGATDSVLLGSVLILGAALCFAFYLYLSGAYIQKYGSRFFASYSTTVSCLAILAHSLLVEERGSSSLSGTLIGLCILTGILCTVLPTYMMHYAISLIGSSRFSILGTSGILCPLVLGILLFSEPLTFFRLSGILLVLVALILLSGGWGPAKQLFRAWRTSSGTE